MKDKNGIELSHKDIVKITGVPTFCEEGFTCAVKIGEGEFIDNAVLYNPNCCKSCRQTKTTWGCYGEPEECSIAPENIEIIGNLDTTPELLPLKEFED